MNQKAARREAAIKKANAKKKILTIIGVLAAILVVGLLIMGALQNNDRVFTADGNQTITLYEDGSFTANLPNGVNIEGMYMEQFEDNITFVLFLLDDGIEVGSIEGGILTPPLQWYDEHGYGREFTLN